MRDYDYYFTGYDVPDYLKQTVINIMRRFSIWGQCDGMYICNVIAKQSGFGNGNGTFETGNRRIEAEKITDYLQYAYGCNILPEEKDDLKEILQTGRIDSKNMQKGIQAYIKRCYKEVKDPKCMDWRKRYLRICIEQANITLQEIKKRREEKAHDRYRKEECVGNVSAQ